MIGHIVKILGMNIQGIMLKMYLLQVDTGKIIIKTDQIPMKMSIYDFQSWHDKQINITIVTLAFDLKQAESEMS